MDLNSSHFFSFLFGIQAFFEFPSGILKETLNPSSGLNSCYLASFELRSKKTQPNFKTSGFQLTTVDFGGKRQGNSTPPPETPANQIKAPQLHTDFPLTQKLTNSKRKTIQNRLRINPEMLALYSINPFTDKISTHFSPTCLCTTLPLFLHLVSFARSYLRVASNL